MANESWSDRMKYHLFGEEKYKMILKNRALEKERQTNPQNSEIDETIHHFSHRHPLRYMQPDYPRFKCNNCDRRGEGKRYHCAECQFDLHVACACTGITWFVHHMTQEEFDAVGIERDTISNSFAHPQHQLVGEYKKESYKCAHCNNSGDGLRYRCDVCDNQYHQVCAKNPAKLTSYLYPNQELKLKDKSFSLVNCDLCGDSGPANALVYSCNEWRYYLHPGCTQWPLYLAHPLHPPHPLVLLPQSREETPDVCSSSACSSREWVSTAKYKYSCKICGIHFHLRCILNHSMLGTGEEVKRKYDGQCISLLPVTNLVLPPDASRTHLSEQFYWPSRPRNSFFMF